MKKLIYVLIMVFALTILCDGYVLAQKRVHKKTWSHRKKGAVIGGAAGAVTGAVISKKHPVKGAVIGGAVGAGAGYLIGKGKDKRGK